MGQVLSKLLDDGEEVGEGPDGAVESPGPSPAEAGQDCGFDYVEIDALVMEAGCDLAIAV